MAVVATSEIAMREVEVAVIDCGSVLRRGKRRRELPKKKKQVQVSGEQRRKTARQV